MLKHIGQDNFNGVLGLSFLTFIFKKEHFVEFSNPKKKQIGRSNFTVQILVGTFWRENFGRKFEIHFFTTKTLQNARSF